MEKIDTNIYLSLIGLAALAMTVLTYLIARDAIKFEAKKKTLKLTFTKFIITVVVGISLLFVVYATGTVDRFVLGLGSLMLYITSLWWFFREVLWHAVSAMSGNKAALVITSISAGTYIGLKVYLKNSDIDPLPFLAKVIVGLVCVIVLLTLVNLFANAVLKKTIRNAKSEEDLDLLLNSLDGIRPASDLLVKTSRAGYIRGNGNNEPDPTRGREAPPPY